MNGPARLFVIATVAMTLAGCMTVDWEKTGQLWVGALCDGWSHCTNDADGDPYTLR